MTDVFDYYRRFLGQHVEYCKPILCGMQTKMGSGEIINLRYYPGKKRMYAVIESVLRNRKKRVVTKIPIEYIIKEEIYCPHENGGFSYELAEHPPEGSILGSNAITDENAEEPNYAKIDEQLSSDFEHDNDSNEVTPKVETNNEDNISFPEVPSSHVLSDKTETENQTDRPSIQITEPVIRRKSIPEFNWDSKMSPQHFVKTISENAGQRHYGIQGYNNSCYMDAAVFTLFSFNDSLDKFLYPAPDWQADDISEDTMLLGENVKDILRSEVIVQLRKKYFVSRRRMRKLRKVLVEEVGPQYKSSYMDVEEFILDLFKIINAPDLFTYSHGGTDIIHQILLPVTWNENEKTDYMTLQYLLEDSFRASTVKLAEIPKSNFIVKLPVSDGKLIPCNAVIPNVILDLSKIIEGYSPRQSAHMYLQAVICLKSSHFATFVCTNPKSSTSGWVFMDSKPATSNPEVHTWEGISENILHALKDNISVEVLQNIEPTGNGFKLFKDAYICVYVS